MPNLIDAFNRLFVLFVVVVVLQTADEKSPLLVPVYIGSRDGKVVNIPLQVPYCCHQIVHCVI